MFAAWHRFTLYSPSQYGNSPYAHNSPSFWLGDNPGMVQNSLQPKGALSTRSCADCTAELLSSPPRRTKRGGIVKSIDALTDRGRIHGTTFVRDMVRIGQRDYVRERDLPGLLHIFPSELCRLERRNEGVILRKLNQALRAERRRGRAAHYSYSLMRHIALMQAVAAEKAIRSKAPHLHSE